MIIWKSASLCVCVYMCVCACGFCANALFPSSGHIWPFLVIHDCSICCKFFSLICLSPGLEHHIRQLADVRLPHLVLPAVDGP